LELSQRKKAILKAIIENYISTAEPVGSKTLAASAGNVSSATVRNEMSELEELGLLEKPHTSAGRVPSPQGYRLYVDELMYRYQSTAAEVEQIRRLLEHKLHDLDKTMAEASSIISEMTGQLGVSVSTKHQHAQVRRIELIPVDENTYALVVVTVPPAVNNRMIYAEGVTAEEAAMLVQAVNAVLQRENGSVQLAELLKIMPIQSPLYQLTCEVIGFIRSAEVTGDAEEVSVRGASRLLSHPEYYNAQKARELLDYMTDKDRLKALAKTNQPKLVNIRIGPENGEGPVKDASFVFTAYDMGEDVSGILGVIGPTRMNYGKIAAQLQVFAEGLSKVIPIRLPREEENNGDDDKE